MEAGQLLVGLELSSLLPSRTRKAYESMRNPRTYSWSISPETSGLLFLAQRLEEALHDYALDSYKAPALNTYTRCQELLRILHDVKSGVLVPKTLVPAVEELCSSLRHDTAAATLCGSAIAKMTQMSWWKHENPRQLAIRAEFLKSLLWKRSYERELRNQLLLVVPAGKEKQRIEHLMLNLAVEWMRLGFSRDYIYYRTRAYFFGIGKLESDPQKALQEFFSYFEPKKRSFDVCLRVSHSITALESVLPDQVATISADPPAARASKPKETSFLAKPHSGVFVLIPGIEALDARSARDEGVRRLQNISTFTYYHVHRTPIVWEDDVLVWDGDHPTVLRASRSPVHKEDECSSEALPARLSKTIVAINPTKLPQESWARLRSALNLHSSAITTADVMVQLTTLWSAVETLVPASADDARIATIADVIVPILSANYPRKLFEDLDGSLRKCASKAYRAATGDTDASQPEWLQCAEWALEPKHEESRRQVLAMLDRNPLLRYRVFSLQKRFANARVTRQTIDEHRQRITWHLRRIYRARNIMVHSGATMPYREAVVENLHSYFHTIVNALEAAFGADTPSTNIDAALLAERMKFESHLDRLQESSDARLELSNLRYCLDGDMS